MAVEAKNLEVADEVVPPVAVNVVHAENWATVAFADLCPSALGALVSSTVIQDDFVHVVEVVTDGDFTRKPVSNY